MDVHKQNSPVHPAPRSSMRTAPRTSLVPSCSLPPQTPAGGDLLGVGCLLLGFALSINRAEQLWCVASCAQHPSLRFLQVLPAGRRNLSFSIQPWVATVQFLVFVFRARAPSVLVPVSDKHVDALLLGSCLGGDAVAGSRAAGVPRLPAC